MTAITIAFLRINFLLTPSSAAVGQPIPHDGENSSMPF
jgi:hypothetical protein